MSNLETATAAPLLSYLPQARTRKPRLWSPFLLFVGLLPIPYLLYYSTYRIIWFFTDGSTYATRYYAYHDFVTRIPFRLCMLAMMITLNLVLLLPFIYFTKVPVRSRLAWRKPRASLVALGVWLLGSLALDVLGVALLYALNIRSASLAWFHELISRSATEAPIRAFLVIAVLGPIAEEILFRGYIQTRLVRRLTPFWGILLTSVLFGIFHRDLGQGFFAVIMGLYLGGISYHTGSIVPSIFCHMAVNAFSTILLFTHETAFLISPPVVAASFIIVVAASFLLAKTSPPGVQYRARTFGRQRLARHHPDLAYD